MADRFYGADVEELRQLAGQFERQAATVGQAVTALTSAVKSAAWKGPGADRFRSTWTSQHKPRLTGAQTILSEQAKALRRNADEQERVSADSGGGGVAGAGAAASAGVGPSTGVGGSGSDSLPNGNVSILGGGVWNATLTGAKYPGRIYEAGETPVFHKTYAAGSGADLDRVFRGGAGIGGTVFSGLGLVGDIGNLRTMGGQDGFQRAQTLANTTADAAGLTASVLSVAAPAGSTAARFIPGVGALASGAATVADGASFLSDLKSGDTKAAIYDGISMLGDAVATAGAFVPPPAGLALQLVGGGVSLASHFLKNIF